MTTFSKETALGLAEVLDVADREMTPGPWEHPPGSHYVEQPQSKKAARFIVHCAEDARSIASLRNHARQASEQLRAACEEVERLNVQLAGAEAANAAISESLVEHAELNGHVERIEECRDWIEHEHIMDGGDTSGRLRDFVESLRVVVHQLDLQRRSRNWYEAAYRAGKQKLVESRVARMRPVYNAAIALRMVTRRAEAARTPAECSAQIIDNAAAFRVLFDAVDAASLPSDEGSGE